MSRTTSIARAAAWMACAVLAMSAFAQGPAQAQDPPAAPATEAAPAETAPAETPPADASIADAPVGTLLAEPVDGAAQSPPESGEPPADTRALDETVQDLKKDVVDLNKELFVLEEELLFPANTQVAVFVSMDIGEFFALDALTLKIDNKEVANYLYTPREAEALLKGGVHRVYLGNLKVGEHQLVAFFSGKGPNQRDYKRGANLKFEKGVGAKYLELKITDRQRKAQPEFAIKDWE
jgi:hypothetical protein